MKKLILILMLLIVLPVCAKTADSRNFPLTPDNALMVTINTLSDMDFKIKEIQSDSGYVLFSTNEGNEYLVLISKNSNNTSNIKIQKMRTYAPLKEIMENIFTNIANNLENIPIRAD